MRAGPSMDYPANCMYRRRDLPVKVVAVYSHWLKIEDPDGTHRWMHVRLLSDQPTAIITGGMHPLRAAPETGARILYRAQPGVAGRISDCDMGWCLIDVRGQKGFIEADHNWGATDGRSEERRVGKESVSTVRYRGSPGQITKKNKKP